MHRGDDPIADHLALFLDKRAWLESQPEPRGLWRERELAAVTWALDELSLRFPGALDAAGRIFEAQRQRRERTRP